MVLCAGGGEGELAGVFVCGLMRFCGGERWREGRRVCWGIWLWFNEILFGRWELGGVCGCDLMRLCGGERRGELSGVFGCGLMRFCGGERGGEFGSGLMRFCGGGELGGVICRN